MLEGKQLILATRPYAIDERAKSWRYTLSTFALLLLAFFVALYPFPPPLRIAAAFFEAMLLSRMFVIYHDYLHKTILNRSAFANVIFSIFGFYMLTPKSVWQRSHDYHHTHNSKLYTSSVGSFPIVTRERFMKMSKGQQINYLFIRHPLTIALGYIFAFTWGMSLLPLIRSPKKHWDALLALLFHFGLIAVLVIFSGWTTALLAVIIPVTIAHGLGSYLFYVQHNFPGVTYEDKEGWTYIGAAFNSTSLLKMNRIMHWFTANIGYHHIHHVNARIPFYRLPEVFKAFPEFQNPKSTTMSPIDIFRCLQLKVWDPQLQRMLTMRELRQTSKL